MGLFDRTPRTETQKAEGRLALKNISLHGPTIKNGMIQGRKQGTHPVKGARASVESQGDIERRVTATRLLTLGVFALAAKKKKDSRELFLTISGPEFEMVFPVNPDKQRIAREWVAMFNTYAMSLEGSEVSQ